MPGVRADSCGMESDLASSLLTARTAQVQQSSNIAVIRKHQEMDAALLQAVDDKAQSPPPPGQGLKVDKFA